MSVIGKSQRLDVMLGPNYRSAVIYAPAGREFICFEPMAGDHQRAQSRAQGSLQGAAERSARRHWHESFLITPSGF